MLFAGAVPWNGLRQRHQALASGLAGDGWDVTYLDPLLSGGWGARLRELGCRLRTLSIRVPFRAAGFPGLQAVAMKLAMIHLAANGVRPSETRLWVGEPSLSPLSRFPWNSIVYDRCDRHGAFPGQRRLPWLVHEQRLYRRADLVFASSPLLADEAAEAGAASVHLVPNAVDARWLFPQPPKRPAGPPFRLVSAGAHYEWTDHAWLAALAEHPGVELHIAGPGRGRGWKDLLARPGVTWHGVLDHAALRELLDRCHIGLIPFRDDPLTAGVDPVKAYEYAARGLAVWAPRIESLRRHPLVTRTLTPVEAADRLGADASLAPLTLRPATWDDRLAVICRLLKERKGR
ncbi:MAG TPA: glycosyltransferase [Candidatus Ozemobacteraceae bacterium]|nr:glycosyltransferase [Candidatus Ozemobacteraceae bacterium]HQG26962.1 glycosyltransferase [Candidatus Ozemobacteraceae bacterium]